MSIITGIFFYAEPGRLMQYNIIGGSQKAIFNQGIHTKMCRLIPIQFEMPIKYVIPK